MVVLAYQAHSMAHCCMHFVYVKVPLWGTTDPASDALHRALEQELETAGVGSLVGWGTSLPSAGATERDPGSFHRVDIEIRELEAGLRVLREALATLKSPLGTELHFTAEGTAWQQSLSEGGWSDQVPRSG